MQATALNGLFVRHHLNRTNGTTTLDIPGHDGSATVSERTARHDDASGKNTALTLPDANKDVPVLGIADIRLRSSSSLLRRLCATGTALAAVTEGATVATAFPWSRM
ncbi:hypothetical protein QF030_007779 [Streptomyces rishiriensis]|uniref:Uncharacterized protein n=1 Tax=Streptomyces rishiriensis TaxID=68264 RepID=A0ABU0P2H8_STRRH|nr:hypothetical protein [Streptomyces rishiriensis]